MTERDGTRGWPGLYVEIVKDAYPVPSCASGQAYVDASGAHNVPPGMAAALREFDQMTSSPAVRANAEKLWPGTTTTAAPTNIPDYERYLDEQDRGRVVVGVDYAFAEPPAKPLERHEIVADAEVQAKCYRELARDYSFNAMQMLRDRDVVNAVKELRLASNCVTKAEWLERTLADASLTYPKDLEAELVRLLNLNTKGGAIDDGVAQLAELVCWRARQSAQAGERLGWYEAVRDLPDDIAEQHKAHTTDPFKAIREREYSDLMALLEDNGVKSRSGPTVVANPTRGGVMQKFWSNPQPAFTPLDRTVDWDPPMPEDHVLMDAACNRVLPDAVVMNGSAFVADPAHAGPPTLLATSKFEPPTPQSVRRDMETILKKWGYK